MPHLLIVGGSDAGIADRYPNFSICGLPFYLSGVTLAPEATAIDLEPAEQRVTVAHNGSFETLSYDELIIATGATPLTVRVTGDTAT